MTINALNSGANVWLADFEDANTPLWENMVTGQLNLIGRAGPDARLHQPGGQVLPAAPGRASWPRSWSGRAAGIWTRSICWWTAQPVSGSLFDFALYFFHCARRQLDAGSGPYFYLPKIESHLEARLWNDVFNLAQDTLGIPRGTIRATVLIETIPAAFEMEEILYELREHCAGLNAGRWDYLFSIIKKFRSRGRDFVLPERNSVTMTAPFMRAYTELLVKTCHRRGAHAMGGMAAFIPSIRDPEVNALALAKVATTRPARPATASTAPGWPTRTWCRCAVRPSTTRSAPAEPAGPAARRRQRVRRRPAGGGQDAGRDHRGRAAQQRQRGPAVPGAAGSAATARWGSST